MDEAGAKVNTYDYNPRGETRATTNESAPQPYRYAGAYQDPTQLYKMGARYYDTNLGRFTQTDPSGQETNPYLYAAGDPVNLIDPDGTDFCSSKAGFIFGGPALCGSEETRSSIGKVSGGITVGATICAAATSGFSPCTPVAAAAGAVSWATTLRD
ncbi:MULTISPECIES: RHS repeat-associated core domain-containing protein [unclassified Streptomyces]|uniref:RHS repeat-associated core domain-containing protein n=1 Tax=unclassified Streptomyces TaxID=2593676 RepID=UPI0037FDB5E8